MKQNLPEEIPVFPLNGVIYFPKTNLPLNIFEERYLQLVNDCIKTNKLMGMVQARKNSSEVYNVGCLGKISYSQKTEDGRMIIKLTGITRFEIIKEVSNDKLYREFKVNYNRFYEDSKNLKLYALEEKKLNMFFKKIKFFFKKSGLLLNWEEFERLEQTQQISTLAMISPFSDEEKQKLLETVELKEKIKILSKIIDFYIYDKDSENKKTIQ
tara:strand:- start:417 stop:1052 length:636 start_codon:yes stop_codon:yes gene_type:complete